MNFSLPRLGLLVLACLSMWGCNANFSGTPLSLLNLSTPSPTPTSTQSQSGPPALVAHTTGQWAGASPVATSSIDTRGARMIAICATDNPGVSTRPTDSAGNAWLLAKTLNESDDLQMSLWYTVGPTTSANHTFSVGGNTPAYSVAAFSNIASGPDQLSYSQGYDADFTTGAVTPTNPNELVFSCMGGYGFTAPATIDSPMTLIDVLVGGSYNGVNRLSAGTAFQVQGAPTSVNPSWEVAWNGVSVAAVTFYSTQNPAPLQIATTSLPEAFAGASYTEQLQNIGGIGPFQWSLASGSLPSGFTLTSGGLLSGTTSTVISARPLVVKIVDSTQQVVTRTFDLTVAPSPLIASSTACASTGTQYQPYGGCTIQGTGGTPPYSYSWSTNDYYASIPEGLSLNASTGAISGTVYGQGGYSTLFMVTDAMGTQVSLAVNFEIAGDSTLGGCTLFPSDSIFHRNISGLPVDTSPAAPISPYYVGSTIKPFFGGNGPQPNGIPFLRVPYNQALVSTVTTLYQSFFTTGPFPWFAPIESSSNGAGYGSDNHVLILQTAGGGNPCKLWEMWQGLPPGATGASNGTWSDSSNVVWNNLSSTGTGAYAMIPTDTGSSDAAGLPVTPLLVNADEVIGTGTASAPNGSVQHPVRFTLNHTLNYYVWPATAHAGIGSCSGGYEDGNHMLMQSNPPTSCSGSSPQGEIYRLKASVSAPACASTSPQSAIIMQGFRNYGIIVADNGISGGLIGTPDSRWNDNDLACLSQLTLADFEPVNVSSLIIDPLASYQSH